jgi:hypothetical protein
MVFTTRCLTTKPHDDGRPKSGRRPGVVLALKLISMGQGATLRDTLHLVDDCRPHLTRVSTFRRLVSVAEPRSAKGAIHPEKPNSNDVNVGTGWPVVRPTGIEPVFLP